MLGRGVRSYLNFSVSSFAQRFLFNHVHSLFPKERLDRVWDVCVWCVWCVCVCVSVCAYLCVCVHTYTCV